jgi:calsequestrin, skeletal muscle isoform, putative
MAYNATNEERTEIVSIKKGSRGDYVKVNKILKKNTNNESIDIRMFYTNDEDLVLPTGKGVRFSTEMLLDFIKGLTTALEYDEKDDLVAYLSETLDEDDFDDEDEDDDDADDEDEDEDYDDADEDEDEVD